MTHTSLVLPYLLTTLAAAGPGLAAEAPGHWLLSVSDVAVSEESCAPHRAVFRVRLLNGAHHLPPHVVRVQYATADGSAVGGIDYTPATGTLTFLPPNHVLTVSVPITDALVPGPAKTFQLRLSNAAGAVIARPIGTATLHAPSVAKCASCALSCDDGEDCTADSCSSSLGCRNVDVNACATAACATGACALDSDGDGLSDAWETNGYVDVNCNGQYDGPAADVPLPGADPSAPDIYLRYDYMEKTGTGAHTHQPPQAALDQMVIAFALHGVTLHIVAPEGSIPESLVTTLDDSPRTACAGDDFATMASLRASHFGNLQPAYHYMVFGHFSTCPDAAHCGLCPPDPDSGATPDPTASGSADVGGDDAIIASANIGSPGPIERVASTIMHELGHNLGLKHGGDDSVNQKPHYLSVMNYTYQLAGILMADAAGSTSYRTCADDAGCGPPSVTTGTCGTPDACHCTDDLAPVLGTDICYRIDYSGLELPALNEFAPAPGVGGLDESVGVSGPASNEDLVLYFAPGPSELVGPSNGAPIDWDDSGGIEAHVQADLNNDAAYTLLSTQNDWETSGGLFTRLNLAFQCAAGAGLAGEWTTDEMSRDYALRHRLSVRRRRAPETEGSLK